MTFVLEWDSWYINDHFLWLSIRNQFWLHKFTVATSCGRQNQSENLKNFTKLTDPFPLIKGRITNKFEDTNICLSHFFVCLFDCLKLCLLGVCVCASTQKKTHHKKAIMEINEIRWSICARQSIKMIFVVSFRFFFPPSIHSSTH